MDDAKYLDAELLNQFKHYGEVLIPNKYIKRWGKENIVKVLRHVMEDDTIMIDEEISYVPVARGRKKKVVDYIAKKEKKNVDKSVPYWWKHYA